MAKPSTILTAGVMVLISVATATHQDGHGPHQAHGDKVHQGHRIISHDESRPAAPEGPQNSQKKSGHERRITNDELVRRMTAAARRRPFQPLPPRNHFVNGPGRMGRPTVVSRNLPSHFLGSNREFLRRIKGKKSKGSPHHFIGGAPFDNGFPGPRNRFVKPKGRFQPSNELPHPIQNTIPFGIFDADPGKIGSNVKFFHPKQKNTHNKLSSRLQDNAHEISLPTLFGDLRSATGSSTTFRRIPGGHREVPPHLFKFRNPEPTQDAAQYEVMDLQVSSVADPHDPYNTLHTGPKPAKPESLPRQAGAAVAVHLPPPLPPGSNQRIATDPYRVTFKEPRIFNQAKSFRIRGHARPSQVPVQQITSPKAPLFYNTVPAQKPYMMSPTRSGFKHQLLPKFPQFGKDSAPFELFLKKHRSIGGGPGSYPGAPAQYLASPPIYTGARVEISERGPPVHYSVDGSPTAVLQHRGRPAQLNLRREQFRIHPHVHLMARHDLRHMVIKLLPRM